MRPTLVLLSVLGVALGAALVSPAGCANQASCERNSDCTQGYCSAGVCKQDCLDSRLDCPAGQHCNLVSQCEGTVTGGGGGGSAGSSGHGGGHSSSGPGPGSSTGASTGGGAGGLPATTSTAATTTTTAATTGTGGAGGLGTTGATTGGMAGAGGALGSKLELDPCASDAECGSQLCRPFYKGGEQRCTRACASSSDCVAGARCDTVGGGKLCVGADIGRPCAAGADCNFGCLQTPVPGYCTETCSSGSDCPNGYGCMPVGNPPTSVCAKAEADCAANASQCIAEAACDMSLVVSSCTTTCNSAADCPQRAQGLAPWSCPSGLCTRPPDVFGPLPGGSTPAQYACNAQMTVVNLCNDAQHLDFQAFTIPSPPAVDCMLQTTTSGVAGDSCVDSCLYQGGCTYGFACTAVGDIAGSRIGLCLPYGLGEVGSACSANGDCAFGYCVTSTGKCSRDCSGDGICPTSSSCTVVVGPQVEGVPFRRCQ